VEHIATSLGIGIQKTPTEDGLSGFLYRDFAKDRTVIGVNALHPENRQRFTIAHELGHFLLHVRSGVHVDPTESGPHIVFRDGLSSEGTDTAEVEANVFASELLMPAQTVLKDLEEVGPLDLLDDESMEATLTEFAIRYKVSKQAITIRIARLGYTHI
jgi:Zn-dependent peptidase ImmA (M78 family)